MSLILIPQISGSVILSVVSDLGQHRAHLGIDLEDRDP
jgi:hypothetical protein